MSSAIQIVSALEVPSPGLIALAGMGTVFVSLTLIYVVMAVMGKYLYRASKIVQSSAFSLSQRGQSAKVEETVVNTKEDKNSKIALAIAIALARHRKNNVKSLSYKMEGGINPWRLSGRLRGLRN